MERILIVSYLPNPGMRTELLQLLQAQTARCRNLGLLDHSARLLGEGTHGEIIYIVTLRSGADIDRAWEDCVFADIDATISTVARIVPLQTLSETAGTYVDLASLPVDG
jgi:hypothetical protein